MNEAHKLNRARNRQKRLQRRFKELEASKTQQQIQLSTDPDKAWIPEAITNQLQRIRERVQL